MNAADITYEWLMESAAQFGYTDHVAHFKALFGLMKVREFLECGCGYSTKFFIDNCEHVTSVEFVNDGFGPEWMLECMEMYKDCKNWEWLINDATPALYAASAYQPRYKKDYALIDDKYVEELRRFFYTQNSDRLDVAFVDCGIYLRGDMVELLLEMGVPVVVAHDYSTDGEFGVYGWPKIKSTGNYERILCGGNTAFWVRKDLGEVVEGMKKCGVASSEASSQ